MSDGVPMQVVITGIGAVTPLGVGVEPLIRRWTAGACGIEDGLGRCADFDPGQLLSVKERRRSDRYTQLAVAAGAEAITQAGWTEMPYAAERVGCVIGTGIGGISTIYEGHETLRGGVGRVSPMLIPNMMPNAAAATLAIRYGLAGEVFGVVSACAAGAHAIGAGLRILQAGVADAMVVGGAESALSPVAMSGFTTMGATSDCGISRPFDRDRDGFVLGEGAAVLVLESAATAHARGATVLGEILGYGATCDAHHLTAPRTGGAAAARAMTAAMDDAGVAPGDVDYVNAHGTSTPLNDRTETASIKAALGDHARDVPISSTKSVIGHLLGAAGAVDAVVTLAALQARVAPPTVGLEHPDEDLDLNYVQGRWQALGDAEHRPHLVGISNSFGFGGHNAVVVLQAWERRPEGSV
jgi:3-oxoacyl-[acyl-carrier-protein] synthase II